MVPVCTTKEYHCFWEPVSLEYNVSGKKFLPSILNVIVYSGSLQQMVEYFRCMYRIPLFHSKLRNSNKEINNNQNLVTEKMPQDFTVHSASLNNSESFKNLVQETNESVAAPELKNLKEVGRGILN